MKGTTASGKNTKFSILFRLFFKKNLAESMSTDKRRYKLSNGTYN